MASFKESGAGRILYGLWWLVDGSRRLVFNGIWLALLAALMWGLLQNGGPRLKPRTTLVLGLQGGIVEQRIDSARGTLIGRVSGQADGQVLLRDLLAAIDNAAQDDQISQALLLLDEFRGAGPATLHEVAAALDRFKAAGKTVYAWGGSYDQRQYYLAAHANQVWLHPLGSMMITGYGGQRNYYKDLLDRVGVTANVFREGKFKNAYESYTAAGPSPETQEADHALYDGLWASWTSAVEGARKQAAGSVAQSIDSLPASLLEAGGDAAKWAVAQHWVDALKTFDEVRTALAASGARDAENKTFRQIDWQHYLGRVKPRTSVDAVGVIVAAGSIGDGRAARGSIGGRSTSELIRQAREDEHIKALVLRVDSPGGSVYGSELIRHELELTRKAGKPVVVSMGDVAASGGYWISTASDEIIADAATITGSIGVIAMLPTARGLYDKLDLHAAGVTTTWLGSAYDPRQELEPRYAQMIQAGVDHDYAEFKSRVAAARKTTPEAVDAIAQGRVWSGQDALKNGLVDRLGSYNDALDAAAKRGGLSGRFRIEYFEVAPGRLALLLQRFQGELASAGFDIGASPWSALSGVFGAYGAVATSGLAGPGAAQAVADLGWLASMTQQHPPFLAVAHCLCEAP
ncbi:MAG: signal peptide peptidase SppA [Burkholderiales bacterium]|nr:signal peptide peptidase SppA [Burkholderiales bacterium]